MSGQPPLARALCRLSERATRRAAETLSAMIGDRRIEVDPAELHDPASLARTERFARPGRTHRLDVEGQGLSFRLFCLFPEESVKGLVDSLLPSSAVSEELENSAMGEVANILGSAYLDVVSESLLVPVVPSPPIGARGPFALNSADTEADSRWISSWLHGDGAVSGCMAVALRQAEAAALAGALGESARDVEALFSGAPADYRGSR